jgi:2-polyprenyl-3-methyl-5-hydroxy-6-metoxy-1,4-benzoquinol methylase
MTSENIAEATKHLESWLKSDVYLENIHFWQRAWNMVKVPYTQLPDLPYLASIPAGLKASGVRSVLDLGCGSGWLSIYLARQGFIVTGIDLAEHAVELAKTWADQEKLEITFDKGDIAELPYPPGSFDAIVANSIFEHFTAELAAVTVARLKSILVPGGTFFGCFDKVGTGPGEYFSLADGTHVYTDKGRQGMLLRNFEDSELKKLFAGWKITEFQTLASGSRIVWANS